MAQIHKLNGYDIFDSVVFDKYCLALKGASYDISYLIYLNFFLTNFASQLLGSL